MRSILVQLLALFSLTAISDLVQANPTLESRIVLLSLTKWTEQHISSIMSADTSTVLQDAVDAFISKDIAMTFNGAPAKRNDYIKSLKADFRSIKSFSAIIEPTNPSSQPRNCACYDSIQEVPSIPVPNNTISGIRGDFNGRRVMSIDAVFSARSHELNVQTDNFCSVRGK